MSAARLLAGAAVGAVLSFASVPAAAQSQIWIEQLGSSGQDAALGAAPDGSGGLYLSGYTFGSLGGSSSGLDDGWLARYDSAGGSLWIQQFGTSNSDAATSAATDGVGGVYIGGYTRGSLGGSNVGSWDAWVARYTGTGSQVWIRQLGSNALDRAYCAAPDGFGGIYLAGETQGGLGGPATGFYDAWLAHYDEAGNLLWVRQPSTLSADHALGLAPDASSGVYVVGFTQGNLGGTNVGGVDAWMARYDFGGQQLWIRQLGTTGDDIARTAAPDDAGGFYVGGSTTGSLGGSLLGLHDAWLARYDQEGNQVWIRQIGSSVVDQAAASAPDGTGGVYVGGSTDGSFGGPSAGGWDAWLARYGSDGSKLGMPQFGTASIDRVNAAAIDGTGGLFVSGDTTGSLGGPSAGNFDAWLARYDPCSTWSYCLGATNSTGQSAVIGNQGSTSIGQNSFVLTVDSCPPSQLGLFFFGTFQTQVAYGDGWLCVTGQQERLPPVLLSASGAATYPLDFTDPTSPASAILAGSVRNFQFWYRDPQLVGSGFNLSNGLSAYFCP